MSRWVITTFLLILLLFCVGSTQAAEGPIARVDVGFAGTYKPGLWTPVRVWLTPGGDLDGANLSLIVPDGDGVPSRVSAAVPSPVPESILLYARFGRIGCPLTVRLDRDGELLAEREFVAGESSGERTIPTALLTDQRLVVAVGTAPLGIADAIKQMREPDEEKTVVVTLESAADLPDAWSGYEGAELVVLSGTDPTCYAGLAADDPRIEALGQWVRGGGRLVIAVGEHGEKLLGGQGPLSALVPGTFVETVSVYETRALDVFSKSRVALPMRVGSKALRVAKLADLKGLTVATQGNLPLVVHRSWGFGQVIFVATDLDRGPIGEWKARPDFFARLVGWPVKPADTEDGDETILHYGYTDLSGQLRSALDVFEGVWQIPFSLVIAAIALYLLLIGPGDYFLLRKLVGRMELTWVTFPATVVLFCGIAYFVAHHTKGDQLVVNQASVIDVEVETGRLRGTGWVSIFSPTTQRFDVRFAAKGLDDSVIDEDAIVAGWLGLPGRALGGMNPVAPPPEVWPEPYDFSANRARLVDMPVQVWSSKSLTMRWNGEAGETFDCSLVQKGPIPEGNLTNRLDFALEECLLVYGDWIYELGMLQPGQTFRVGLRVPRRELVSFLTGRKIVFDAEESRDRETATRYQTDSRDVAYILRAMTFFKKAGGRPYTHLGNNYQGFVDLSDQLQADRAVLLAKVVGAATDRAPRGGARIELSVNGEIVPHNETHTTIMRFVLPVTPEQR